MRHPFLPVQMTLNSSDSTVLLTWLPIYLYGISYEENTAFLIQVQSEHFTECP